MISAERTKFEEDLETKRSHLSEDQIQQLMNEHTENVELLTRNINIEKERQLNSLSDKIAERRKMKADILARRHEADMAKELLKQREERSKLEDDRVSLANFLICSSRPYSTQPYSTTVSPPCSTILYYSNSLTLPFRDIPDKSQPCPVKPLFTTTNVQSFFILLYFVSLNLMPLNFACLYFTLLYFYFYCSLRCFTLF